MTEEERVTFFIELEHGEGFECRGDQSVLAGMATRGRRDLVVGCRSGGCGVCKVQVLSGRYHTGRMSRGQVSVEDEARGEVLACQLFPQSDLRVRLLGRGCDETELCSTLPTRRGRSP